MPGMDKFPEFGHVVFVKLPNRIEIIYSIVCLSFIKTLINKIIFNKVNYSSSFITGFNI